MRALKNIFATLVLLGLNSHLLKAQTFDRDVLSSNGDYISSSSISLEFTTGEAAIGMYSSSSVLLSQGFNQSDTSTNPGSSGIKGLQKIPFTLFPNPGRNTLNISSSMGISFSILDATCKEVLPAVQNTTANLSIDVSHLASGIYYVQATNANGSSSTQTWIKQ